MLNFKMGPYEMPKTVAANLKKLIRKIAKQLSEADTIDVGLLAEFNKMINIFSRLQEIIQQSEPELPEIKSETGYRRGAMRGPY